MDGLVGDLENSFEELNISVDKPVLVKCVEICNQNNVLDAEEFVNSWIAYSLSKLHGENPTISNLTKFERDEYGEKKKANGNGENGSNKSSVAVYEVNSEDIAIESANIMKMYDDSSFKERENASQPRTPENSMQSRNNLTQQVIFSPASFSPAITSLSSKYNSRTSSGEVVFPFKKEDFTSNQQIPGDSVIKIDYLNSVGVEHYMNFDLIDALDYAEEMMNKIGSILIQKYALEDVMPVCYKHPTPFVTIGRIACDSDGRLNSKSVVLEGSRELSSGEVVQLDLESVEKYSIFPGQVVAIEGVNVSGEKLMAKKIYYDASPESPSAKPRGEFSITIAAGPFTQSNSITYQPLVDLIELTSSEEPDFLILIGPFLDCNHPAIIENFLAETHEELFQKIVHLIMKPLESKKTQVIMVSSYKDCTGSYMYPTPQLPLLQERYENLHLLPDPSLFEIAGTVIGVTSTDTLIHIGKEEISSPGYSTDRLSRIANHILFQRSFYPLSPAAGVPVDPSFMELVNLDIKPHILILPSDLRYFIKDVSGCTVVNPERLAKGMRGGTYARFRLDSSGLVGNVIRI